MIRRNLDFIVNLKFIKNKIVSFKIDRAVKENFKQIRFLDSTFENNLKIK